MKKSLLMTLFALPLFVSPVYADDDDDSGVFMKNLLTKAGIVGDKKEIKYQERPPLVLPPSVTGKSSSLTLPTPSQSASAQSKNWPVDPDAEKARKDAERAKKPQIQRDAARKLTPEELNRGRVAGAGMPQTPPSVENNINPTAGSGSFFRSRKDEDTRIEFKGEAPRISLIQPPPGYKTPSASQPYGPVGKTDYGEIKVENKDAKKQ